MYVKANNDYQSAFPFGKALLCVVAYFMMLVGLSQGFLL